MAATGIYYVKVGKKRKGIRGMIWRFLPDRGNKIGRIRFWQHNQTGHIASFIANCATSKTTRA
jgi:hypothetical protein